MTPGCHRGGFSLVELLIAMGIGAFLLTGIVRLAQATTAGFQLQQALGQVQENARFLASVMQPAIQQAGFRPEPWEPGPPEPAIAPGTADGINPAGDRLVLRRWSDRNCFDNPNPALDAAGQPLHFMLEKAFQPRANGSLVHSCRYGPDAGELVTQINNFGLADGVEALELQFAEDSDGDGHADRWIRAGQWQAESRVLGVRFALLLASPFPATERSTQTFQIFDRLIETPADGRLRGVFQSTVALHGRIR